MPSFSVIIPCYHDEQKLIHLLDQLRKLPHSPAEIIVVDGANSEECREICLQHQARWLTSEPCRGRQLLMGAKVAQSDALWFLHADVRVPSDPLIAMAHAIGRGAVGGYFRFCFDAPRAWPASILELAIALRCRFGVPYGDQGIFVLRQMYFMAGGHAPMPLFEEVSLVHGLRQLGSFIPLQAPLFVDSRRWQRDGWWQRTWKNRRLALNYMYGIEPDKLAARYYSRSKIK